MSKFINHAAMISDKGKFPFIIANADSSEIAGVHWWSILDIEPRNDIFYLFFRSRRSKTFHNPRRQKNNR